jgi:DNA-binding transcriptional MocR family regulator
MSLHRAHNSSIVTEHWFTQAKHSSAPLRRSTYSDLQMLLAESVTDRSARGIAAAVGRMITAGDLVVGQRLPTVRALARQLGVSPTTVSEAWQSLAKVGAIDARGRQGTFVASPTGPATPRRYRRVTEGPGHFPLDLSTGTPDPALLPDLGPVIARVSRQSLTSSYLDQPVLPDLAAALRHGWPFPPESLTVVDGAMDALDRVAQLVVSLGDRVVVENPAFPPLVDLLEQLGAEIIGVDLDDQGPDVTQMLAALALQPVAVFLQPRAQNPTGVTMSGGRAGDLATALAASTAIVVEDDHSGDIASGDLHSIGQWLPTRTVHIRSYSKSHGPDLRLAAVGGAGDVVAAVANRRLLGPGWSSRILQAVLLEMLDHQPTIDTVAVARAEYARRRALVADALAAQSVDVTGTDGINLWVGVDNERSALLTLAANGIGVAPGEPFVVGAHRPSLRVTVGLLDRGHEHVADQLVMAAGRKPASTGLR